MRIENENNEVRLQKLPLSKIHSTRAKVLIITMRNFATAKTYY